MALHERHSVTMNILIHVSCEMRIVDWQLDWRYVLYKYIPNVPNTNPTSRLSPQRSL